MNMPVLFILLCAGLGEPEDDSRNALIVRGATSDLTLKGVAFKNAGCYVWDDADAALDGCTVDGGLHGLYVWGKGDVTAERCTIRGTERSGVTVRDGATVTITARFALLSTTLLLRAVRSGSQVVQLLVRLDCVLSVRCMLQPVRECFG